MAARKPGIVPVVLPVSLAPIVVLAGGDAKPGQQAALAGSPCDATSSAPSRQRCPGPRAAPNRHSGIPKFFFCFDLFLHQLGDHLVLAGQFLFQLGDPSRKGKRRILASFKGSSSLLKELLLPALEHGGLDAVLVT